MAEARKNTAPKPRRERRIHVAMTDDEIASIDAVAEREGVTRSDVLRGVLRGRFELPNVRRMA